MNSICCLIHRSKLQLKYHVYMTNYVYKLEEVEETSTVDSVEIILRGQKKCDHYMLARDLNRKPRGKMGATYSCP
jgi:hypothetical protein